MEAKVFLSGNYKHQALSLPKADSDCEDMLLTPESAATGKRFI